MWPPCHNRQAPCCRHDTAAMMGHCGFTQGLAGAARYSVFAASRSAQAERHRSIARAHEQAPASAPRPPTRSQPRIARTNAVALVGQESLAFDPSVRGSKSLKRQTIAEFATQKVAGTVVQAI